MATTPDNKTVNAITPKINGFNAREVITAPPDDCRNCLTHKVAPFHSILLKPGDAALMWVRDLRGEMRELGADEHVLWGQYRCDQCSYDWSCYWRMESLG